MSDWRRFLAREDLLLLASSVALGLAAGIAFAVFRAVSVSGDSSPDRLAVFGENLLWPGALILAAIAIAVWVGWKANLD